MDRQWRALFAIGVVMALVVAACSSSSKPKAAGSAATTTGSGSDTTTAGGAAQASGSDIVVEGLAQLAFYPSVDTAFQARITRFNNAGGLNGRKIKFLGVQETGTDPAKALSATQSVILKDHVFAVAPIASEVVLATSTDFMVQNKTPYFGWGISPAWCNNDWGFGVNGCLTQTAAGPLFSRHPWPT